MKVSFRARIASGGKDRLIIIVPFEYRDEAAAFKDDLLEVTLENVEGVTA